MKKSLLFLISTIFLFSSHKLVSATTTPLPKTDIPPSAAINKVYKGEIFSTSSAQNTFSLKTEDNQYTIQADKNTKILIFNNKNQKTRSTFSHLKYGDKVYVISSSVTTPAKFIFNQREQIIGNSSKIALSGTVSNREASGSAVFFSQN